MVLSQWRDGRPRPSPAVLTNLLFAPKFKNFLLLFAVVTVDPFLGVVICVCHREHQASHVTVIRTRKIGGIEEVERKSLAVGRSAGHHPGLVAGTAVVGHREANA